MKDSPSKIEIDTVGSQRWHFATPLALVTAAIGALGVMGSRSVSAQSHAEVSRRLSSFPLIAQVIAPDVVIPPNISLPKRNPLNRNPERRGLPVDPVPFGQDLRDSTVPNAVLNTPTQTPDSRDAEMPTPDITRDRLPAPLDDGVLVNPGN